MKYPAFYLLLCCVLTACNPPLLEKESPTVNSVEKGRDFRIRLPEDHSTGYTWQLSEGYDKNLISLNNIVWHGNEKGVDFHLSSLASGQTTLGFVCRKYTDTLGMKTYIVKIGN